jgi:ubiquinone/menaquinone biosynthesis C-methylase UbiE
VSYDGLGFGYDQFRHADPYLVERLRAWMAPRANGRYLDAGCGTGNYTLALAASAGRWFAADHSARMLAAATAKVPMESPPIPWLRGDILRLPYAPATFDAVVLTLVIHHLPSLEAGFESLARLLAPDGRLVVFTSTAEQMAGYWLNHYFPRAMARSIEQMPSAAALARAAHTAGLRELGRELYVVRTDLDDGFLYKGKHEPQLYLDPAFRRCISTFASLADADEVESGCTRLAADLDAGAFDAVARRYANDGGDYLFLAYGVSPPGGG